MGKVNRVQMYPMSFYEFVLADGGRQCIEGVSKYPLDRELPEIYTGALEKYLRHYYIVGGMPEVVLKWVETHRFDEVDALQENIIQDYSDDFAKHAPLSDIPKLGFKCSMKNAALNDVEGTATYNLPLYLIWRLKDLTT